jgi:hypothetical protein
MSDAEYADRQRAIRKIFEDHFNAQSFFRRVFLDDAFLDRYNRSAHPSQ